MVRSRIMLTVDSAVRQGRLLAKGGLMVGLSPAGAGELELFYHKERIHDFTP
jgi:hypothetical protein